MTTPVAITLTSLGAQSDSPTATTPAVDGSPFADILALLSQPGNKQALLQNLQASLDGDAKGPQSALLGRLSQLDAQQRQTLLEQLRTATPDGVTPCPMPPLPCCRRQPRRRTPLALPTWTRPVHSKPSPPCWPCCRRALTRLAR
ncbi:hypothetical protein ACNJKD_12990 [Edwardsiella tarda]|uniref:hypothetical protein n=1 Tax=Edwardsiella tarda TaxID=636 RepID=UPI003A8A88C9